MRQGSELVKATLPFAREVRPRSWWHLGTTLALLIGLLVATCLPMPWFVCLPCSVLAGLVLVRMFVLYHDYQHGAILQGSRVADAIMWAYGLLTVTPPSIWNRSHNHHHQHNAKAFGDDIGSFPIMTTDTYANAGRWERLIYRAARSPWTILLGYFTVFLYGMCLRPWLARPRKHRDAPLSLILHLGLAATLASFAPALLLWTFLLPLMVAGAIGAYLFYAQHNFPDVQLNARGEWNYVFAALHTSSCMILTPLMHWFTGNIGYHHVHHLNPRIPFYRLPRGFIVSTYCSHNMSSRIQYKVDFLSFCSYNLVHENKQSSNGKAAKTGIRT